MLANPRIVCAAIKNGDKIIVGARHYDALMRTAIPESEKSAWITEAEQGFIDQFCKFWTREEAFEIAVKENQIFREIPYNGGRLYSENLY